MSHTSAREYAEFRGGRTGKRFIGVLLNKSDSFFKLSEEAMRMYCRIKSIDYNTYHNKNGIYIDRTDPDMIDIVQEIGLERASPARREIEIELIPWSFRNHFDIKQQEGFEFIELNVQQYKMDRISLMMQPQATEHGREPRYVQKLKAAVLDIINDKEYDNYHEPTVSNIRTA